MCWSTFGAFYDDTTLRKAEVFDLMDMPSQEDTDSFRDYRKVEVLKLCEHFQTLLMTDICIVAEVERVTDSHTQHMHTQHHKRRPFPICGKEWLLKSRARVPIYFIFSVFT